jgi:hypothetical protein
MLSAERSPLTRSPDRIRPSKAKLGTVVTRPKRPRRRAGLTSRSHPGRRRAPSREQVVQLFAPLARGERGKAIVMVLHDLHLAARFADHAIALGGGRARTGAATDILTATALSELFGHRLVRVGEGATVTFVPS